MNKQAVVRRMVQACCADCGDSYSARAEHIASGASTRCRPCANKRRSIAVKTHGESGTRLYRILTGMKERCYNPKKDSYQHYGGRGIKICRQWMGDYMEFKRWALSNGYTDNGTIERIDVDGDYSPENCTWIPAKNQSYNRTINKNNTSGFAGIYRFKQAKRWDAYIKYQRKQYFIGSFGSAEDAADARDQYIIDNNLPHRLSARASGYEGEL